MIYFSKSKRIINVIFIALFVVLALFNTVDVLAQSAIDYSLVTTNCDTDRLFDVDVVAEGSASISAVNIAVIYDNNYLDFRSVKTADKNIKIKSVTSSNSVSTVILCAYGYRFDRRAKLMTFKFKSLKSGKSKINLYVSDAVSKDLKSIPIGNVYSTDISIESDGGVVSKEVKSSNNYKNEISSNKKTINKNDKKIKEKTQTQPTTKSLGNEIVAEDYNKFSSDGLTELDVEKTDYSKYIIGGFAVLAAVIIVYAFYHMGRSKTLLEDDDKDM